jgi:hypothetical protein
VQVALPPVVKRERDEEGEPEGGNDEPDGGVRDDEDGVSNHNAADGPQVGALVTQACGNEVVDGTVGQTEDDDAHEKGEITVLGRD